MFVRAIEPAAAVPSRREATPRLTYRFGPFMLDAGRQLLLSGSAAKPLPDKLFSILLLLLKADGGVVEKQTFFENVWPEGWVSEANLTQHIFMLRQMLGERARQNAYIVTVAGIGYRFAVPVESKLGLSMKGACEQCAQPLAPASRALICSYECTFCPACAQAAGLRCPNCAGELVERPRREAH